MSENSLMKFVLQKRLKQLMKEQHLNVPRLSKLTGISRQTLSNWTAGQKPKNIEQVKTVADLFGVTIDDLCFGVRKEQSETIQEYKNEINAGVFEVVLRRVKK